MWQAFVDGLSLLGEKRTVVLGAVSVICLACSASLWLARDSSEHRTITRQSILLPGFFFSVSAILRLAFVGEAFVPPYFDSVEHYRIIKQILAALETSTFLEMLPRLTPNYYHLGFHFLASLLAFGLRANPMDVILVLGQVILAAIPIPLFFLLWRETQNSAAAFLGMLLAGFGWYMPGFAVNWGKYPALAGLLAFEIVLVSAYFIALKRSAKNYPALIGLLLPGMIVSTLFHTRTLVVIAISIASWMIAGKFNNHAKRFKYLALVILLTGILSLSMVVGREPLLTLALEPYLGDGIWITWMVLVLSPFALIEFPRGFYFGTLFIFGVLSALFIPIGIQSPGLENQTLLDRPFVEMALYFPMSILGGLGLAGLLNTLGKVRALPEKTRPFLRVLPALLILVFAGLTAIGRYDFYPSDCCKLVAYDDTIALDWLDRNLPPDAHILIPVTQLSVLPTGPSSSLVGTDAGIWIPALTGRAVSQAPFDTDFRTESTLEQLCRMKVDYIYVGGTGQSFNPAQLQAMAGWFERILFLPNAQLYQLIGCTQVTFSK